MKYLSICFLISLIMLCSGCTAGENYTIKKLSDNEIIGKKFTSPEQFFTTINAPFCNDVDWFIAANHYCHYSKEANHIVYTSKSTVSHLASRTTVQVHGKKELTVTDAYNVQEPFSLLKPKFAYNVIVLTDESGDKYEIRDFMLENWHNFSSQKIPYKLVNQYCFVLKGKGIGDVKSFLKDFGLVKAKVEERHCYFMKKPGVVLIFESKDEYAIFSEFQRLIPGLVVGS